MEPGCSLARRRPSLNSRRPAPGCGCYVDEDICTGTDSDWETLCKDKECYEQGVCGDHWCEGATNWLQGGSPKDPTRGVSIMSDKSTFRGFEGAGTMYFDIAYSHSVLFIFLFAIPFCLYHLLKEKKSPIAVVSTRRNPHRTAA